MNNNILIPKLRFKEFEGEWRKELLDNITDSENSSLALNTIDSNEKVYAVYGADGIIGYTNEYKQAEEYISIVKDGSGVGRLKLCKPRSSILGTLAYITSKDVNKFHLNWIYYSMETIDFSTYVKGSGIPHIYYRDYKNESVAVPTPEEQQKISSTLSSLDSLIESHNEKLELLKEHKKGLMQNLFPQDGETVPKYRFKEFEGDGEWEEKKLGEVANYVNGKAHEQYIDDNGCFTVVNSKFISTESKIAKFSSKAFCIAGVGDILMVLSDVPNGRAIAKCFYVTKPNKYTVNQRVCKLSVVDYCSEFLFYILNRNPYFISYDDGVNQTNLKRNDVEGFIFLIPNNKKEQNKIVSILSSLDELINSESIRIDELKEHKKGLMQGMFPRIN